jgi:hypothetical protein
MGSPTVGSPLMEGEFALHHYLLGSGSPYPWGRGQPQEASRMSVLYWEHLVVVWRHGGVYGEQF